MKARPMTARWPLLDTASDIYQAGLRVGPADVFGVPDARGASATPFSVHFRRLQGGLRDGVDAVEIDNGRCRLTILPTRGMGLWQAECDGVPLRWQSPVAGPVHPRLVPLMEPAGLGWLSGFDELLCRCGLETNGPPLFNPAGQLQQPLHGRIANTPAQQVELAIDPDSGQIVVTGEVTEARLFHNSLRMTSQFITQLGEPGFTLIDTVTNFSAEPGWLSLLYHINIGTPWLQPGARVHLPLETLAPRDPAAIAGLDSWHTYPQPKPHFPEQAFYTQLIADEAGQTQVLLHDQAATTGVSLKFNRQQLPWFVLWKNMRMPADGYVTGLEPALNLPNLNPFEREQGRAIQLEPGESRQFEIAFEIHSTPGAVQSAAQAVAALQGDRQPKIFTAPLEGWSPQ